VHHQPLESSWRAEKAQVCIVLYAMDQRKPSFLSVSVPITALLCSIKCDMDLQVCSVPLAVIHEEKSGGQRKRTKKRRSDGI
jgi:hypothetical protein